MRSLYPDWSQVAHACVALLRRDAAEHPDDPQLTALVGELSVKDPDFRQWWAAHHVSGLRIGTKHLRHPVVGDLTLDWDTLTSATDPDQQLILWTAAPDSPSHERLRILSSWTTPHQPAPDSTQSTRD